MRAICSAPSRKEGASLIIIQVPVSRRKRDLLASASRTRADVSYRSEDHCRGPRPPRPPKVSRGVRDRRPTRPAVGTPRRALVPVLTAVGVLHRLLELVVR